MNPKVFPETTSQNYKKDANRQQQPPPPYPSSCRPENQDIHPLHNHGKNYDIEAAQTTPPLYPSMTENPSLRWSFIRKVYSILTLQLLLTIGVACGVVLYRPIPAFFKTTPGLGVYILILLVALFLLWPLHVYRQKHPVNFLLLGLFTICMSFGIGFTCAITSGKIILEAVILTAAVVVSLTLYTFWAAKRGHDFNFLGPFLLSALLVLIIFGLIQWLFPLGKIAHTAIGCVGAIVFSGFIIYDTDNLIKRYTYDEYIIAAIALYLDILNLFLYILQALGGGGGSSNS